jgi:hypothetical protein
MLNFTAFLNRNQNTLNESALAIPKRTVPEGNSEFRTGPQKDQFQRHHSSVHFGSAMPPPGPPGGGGHNPLFNPDELSIADNFYIPGYNPYSETGRFEPEFVPVIPSEEAGSSNPRKKEAPPSTDSANKRTIQQRERRKRMANGIRLAAPPVPDSAHANELRASKARLARGIHLRAPANPDSTGAKKQRRYQENKVREALRDYDIDQCFKNIDTVSTNLIKHLRYKGVIDKKLSTAALVTVVQEKLDARKGAAMVDQGRQLMNQGYQLQHRHAQQLQPQAWSGTESIESGYSEGGSHSDSIAPSDSSLFSAVDISKIDVSRIPPVINDSNGVPMYACFDDKGQYIGHFYQE